MWKCCRQVALTYFTRKLLLLFLGIFGLITLPLLFIANSRSDPFARNVGALLPMIFFQAYVGFFLGAHLKQQFANPRGRLLPGFAGSHLLVAMLFFVTVVAWSVLPVVGKSGVSLVGFLAITIHLGALGLRLGCSPHPAGIAAFLLTIGLPATEFGRGLVTEIATGAEPILALALISAHVASLVLLLNHLVGMNEDDPDYSKVQSLNAFDMRAATQRNFQRNASLNGNWMLSLLSANAAGRLERAISIPATASRQRVALFGLGDNWPSPFWINVVVIVVLEVVLLLLGGRDRIQSSQSFRSALFLPMTISFALVWGQWMPWMLRWPRLGYESLRPVSRHDWVWENGVAIAKTIARNQVFVTLIQVLIVAFLFPKYLTEPSLWEALIWISGCQVLLFGICAWLTSYGSLLLMGLVIGPCFALLAAPWGIPLTPLQLGWGIPLTVCLSLGMSLLGWATCRFAFRRWCQMDLP
ncbi:MAG: hypothetical protein ACKV2Q_35450 [Planctomycetaceae bacterium]